MLPVFQLPGDIRVPDDGACNQLGEQGDVCAEVDQIFLRRDAAAIDVDGVAQALEGVKADADGQRKMKQRNFRPVTAFRLPMKKSAYLKPPAAPR